MASSPLSTALLELTDLDVTVRDGNQLSDHDGSLSLTRDGAGGTAGEAVTLELAVDRVAARENAMSVTLSSEDVAALAAALAEAREEG